MSTPADTIGQGRADTTEAAPGREAVVAETAARASAWTAPAGTSVGLAGGTAGTALLLVELSRHDPALRPAAHARLAAAAHSIGSAPGSDAHGLHDGLAGLAFALKAAVRAPGDYATVRAQLDAFLGNRLRRLLDLESARLAERTAPAPRERFDVVNGATGLGRYFLADPVRPEEVRDVLRYLVALTEPISRDGRTLPGWTVPSWPGREAEGDMIDLGLAHGIAGPLALLSLCWTKGVRVPDQETAVRRVADWLMSRLRHDDAGPYWPSVYPVADEAAGGPSPQEPPHRPSWCYGTPGVARAMQLAGTALGEEEWVRAAADAVRGVHRRPGGLAGLTDPGLCHGLAGLAHITRVVAADLGDPDLARHAAALIDRLSAGFAPGTAFGYPTRTGPVQDTPTFLEGAAGVALTLHRPDAPAPWDAVLLLT